MHAYAMGFFVGALDVRCRNNAVCPRCNGRMSPAARLCVQCSNQELTDKRWNRTEREANKWDRHHRFEAAVQAGWSEQLLLATLCALPTWEEIYDRDPSAVAKYKPDLAALYSVQKGMIHYGA